MRRIPLRLIAVLAVGLGFLYQRMKSHEDKYGGPARYEGRGSNVAAWERLRDFRKPTPEAMLSTLCRYACKDSTWKHTLLPEDNFHHMLASLSDQDPKMPPLRDPEKFITEVMWQEESIDLRGKVNRETTLEDILRLLNGVPSLHP